MKICIVGTGAVGGLLAGRLAACGHELTLVDQGERLAALRDHGLAIRDADGSTLRTRRFRAVSAPEATGECDLLILAVKAHQIPDIAPYVSDLLAPGASVLTVQNGIPWWYLDGAERASAGPRLQSLDPDGSISHHIPSDRVVGGIFYGAARIAGNGTVEHVEGDLFPVGDPTGTGSERVTRTAALLEEAGFRSRVLEDLRGEIWVKAMGSAAFNPISALTGLTMAGICRNPATRELATLAMQEARQVATAHGDEPRVTVETRLAGAERVGDHKTSMLQDVEAGEPLEHEALVGAVCELGRLVSIPTPHLDTIYALVAALDARIRSSRPQPPGRAIL